MVNMAAGEVLDFRGVLSRTMDEGQIPTEQHYNDANAVLLAGRAAEEIQFDGASVLGVASTESDLALATAWARQIETRSGLGEAGLVDLDDPVLRTILPNSVIGSVRRRLELAIARASAILLDRAPELEKMAATMARGSMIAQPKQPVRVLH
jgi:ATP-dependent Zn protease